MKKIIYLVIVLCFGIRSFGQVIKSSGPVTFCAGGQAVLTVSPATGITGYQWVRGGTNVGTGASYTATASGSYSVKLTRTPLKDTTIGPVAIIVNALPKIIVNSAATCSNQPATLAASGADTYTWSPATGLSAATGSLVTANPSATTVYTVTGKNTATGCSNTATSTVTVSSFPVANFSFAPSGKCSSVPVLFTNSSTGGTSYEWDFGDPNSGSANTSTDKNPSHNFVGAPGDGSQTFTVKLTVKNAAGCENTKTLNNIITTQLADGTLGGTGKVTYNGEIYFKTCGTTTGDFTFTNQSTTGTTNTNYQIVWGDNSTDFTAPDFSSTTHTYATGSHPILLIVTGKNGCIDTTKYFAFVGTNPAVGLVNPGNTSVCTNGSLTFPISGTASNVVGTLYTLTFNDGTEPINYIHPNVPSSITHVFNNTSCGTSSSDGTTNYDNSFSANIVASNPCKSSAATVVPIYVSRKPKASFDVSPGDTACINELVTLTNTSKNEYIDGTCLNGNSVWTITPATGWAINSGILGNDFGNSDPGVWLSGSQELVLKFSIPGVYTVKIKTGNPNCGLDSISRTICITVPPTPSFILNGVEGCAPFNTSATNTSTLLNSCGPPNYLWSVIYTPDFCGTVSSWDFAPGSSDTSANASFIFKNAGSYTITLQVSNACGPFTTSQTISVKKPPSVGITIPSYPCGPVTVTPIANDTACGTGTLSYAWTFAGGIPAVSNSKDPGPVSFSAVGSHAITLKITNECGTSTATQSVTVTTAPDVKTTPDQSRCGGESVGPFNFSSTIGTPSYNWTNSDPSIGLAASGTGNIPSFTTINDGASPIIATIIVTPFVSADCSGISDTFTITVNPRPSAPLANTEFAYCLNTIAAPLSATPAGTNTLTWYNNSNLTGGTATAPTPSTTVAGTTTYYVTQKNSGGCESPATLITIIINPSISGNRIATDQNICSNTVPGELITINSVSGGSGSFNYQWQSSTDAGVTWANIPAANTETYLPSALLNTLKYRRIISSSTCSDTSNIITITVQGALTNYNISANQTICEGSAPDTLKGQIPTGGGGSYKYAWESSTDNTNWVSTGIVTNDYKPTALLQTTYFRRQVSASQCNAVSNVITITVTPVPAGNLIAPVPAICTTDAGNVSFTAIAGTAPFNIELLVTRPGQADTIVTQTINSTGPASINVIGTASVPGRYTITLTKISDANGCNTPTGNISKDTIDVISPIVNVIQKDSIICAGTSLLIQNQQLTGGGTPGMNPLYSYQWESTPAGQTNWEPIPNSPESTLLVTPSSSTCYRRKVTSNGLCESTSNEICITVNATIANNIIRQDQLVCVNKQPDNLTGDNPTGGDNTYTYQWQTSTDSINWTTVATTANYPTPAFPIDGIHYFRRNVSGGGCTAASNVVTIIVKPTTKALFTANPTTVCNAVDIAGFINVTPFPNGNSLYQWYADGIIFGSNTTGIFPGYIIENPAATVIIKLKTTSQYGCLADSIQQQFKTFITAQAIFTKDSSFGCGPLPVNFTNVSSILNGIQFFWDFGNGDTSTLTQPGIVKFGSSPFFTDTTYQITLKAYNGCDTTIWRDSVKVRANPKARFGVDTTFGCAPFTVKINNASLGGPGKYYWDFGDGTTETTSDTGTLAHKYNVGNVVDTFVIRLIAENECSRDTQSINIRIAPNPIQPFINVNSSELFGCASHTVVFNNHTTAATKFTWDYGDGSVVEITNNNQDTIRHTFINAGVFTVAIDVTNGCSDTTVFRQITVYPKPRASFTTDKDIYCEGDTIKITNASTNATNYQFFWGDGTTSAGTNPTHVYSVAGNYNVLLHAEQSNISGVVCFDSLIVPVTVLARPVVTVQSNIQPVNCAPFTLNVSAPGIINEHVTWSLYDSTVTPSLITANGISTHYTFNKPGTFYVKLVASNANNCSDSTIISFTVRGKAVASFTPANLAVCTADTTINYSNTSTYDGTDPISYQWLVNDVLVSTGANFTHQYAVPPPAILPVVFTTSLIVSNTAGCSDTASATLQVNPRAKAQFVITNPDDCPAFQLKINNNSTYSTIYNWLVNGVSVSNDSIPVIVITEGATLSTISLIADNIYGCKPDTFTIKFTSRAKPHASFTLSDTLGCSGQLNVLTTNLTTAARTYLWDWGDGATDGPAKNYSHLYTSEGQYLIQMVASDGVCTDTTRQLVKVSVKPVADFSVDQTLTCDTARVHFTNLTSNGSAYTWTFGDGTFSNATDPSKSYAPSTVPNTVKLVADGTFGCKDSLIKPNLVLAKLPPAGDFQISPSAVINVPDYTFSFNNLTLSSANYKYLWSFGDGSFAETRDVTHKYADTGNYSVRLIVLDTVSNCPDTTLKIARIIGFPGYLYVPNAFYPNSARNEFKTFKPLGKGLADYQLQIFDSWGKLLFETRLLDAAGAPSAGWDGTYNGSPAPQDTYAWKIKATFKSGKSWDGMVYSNIPGKIKGVTFGTLTLFR